MKAFWEGGKDKANGGGPMVVKSCLWKCYVWKSCVCVCKSWQRCVSKKLCVKVLHVEGISGKKEFCAQEQSVEELCWRSPKATTATQKTAASQLTNQARHQSHSSASAASAAPATRERRRGQQVPGLQSKVVPVCERIVCVRESCVWKSCVWSGGGGTDAGGSAQQKNKNSTQWCGELS